MLKQAVTLERRSWQELRVASSQQPELLPLANRRQGTECRQEPCELGHGVFPSRASDETTAQVSTFTNLVRV